MSDIQEIMTGNKVEKREAVEAIAAICDGADTGCLNALVAIYNIAKAALAAPPRNCAVGTAEEQFERWKTFCLKYDNDCTACPCDGYTHPTAYCFAKWSQMPYEAKEKGGAA